MAFLAAHGISKSYVSPAGRTEVLGKTDLELEKGEFLAIVGYSGSGKSTLISILAGLLQPDTGTVSLDGKVVERPGPDRGLVFQNYSLLPWLSALENIRMAVAQVFPSWPAKKQLEHAERFLDLVHLSAARDKKPAQLSGGMRQRVAVARALALDPAVLLLDEPLGALDALTRASLQSEIEAIWRQSQKTVVLITNDVDEGILLADRIIPLSAGPAATLGPSFPVEIERPRNRRAMNHDPRYKQLRADIIRYLTSTSRQATRRRSPQLEVATEARYAAPLEDTRATVLEG